MRFEKFISVCLVGVIAIVNINIGKLTSYAKERDPYGVIDNDNPINIGYDFLMESDEPLKIRKSLLGKNVIISNMVGLYGDLREEGSNYTYTLKDFLNGVEEFNINIDGKDELLRIVPAPEMVYDSDFIGINYDSNFETEYDDRHYGGSAVKNADKTIVAKLSFEYKGASIEMSAKTTNSAGKVSARLYSKNEFGEYTLIPGTSQTINTKVSNTLNNFKRKIYICRAVNENINKRHDVFIPKNNISYIDFFKIYNPLGNSQSSEYIKALYEKYNPRKTDYIDVYANLSELNETIFEKWLFMSPEFTKPTENDIAGRVVFESLEGKYGDLTYDNTTYGGINTFYKYELKGWLTGIEKFNITIDGVPKVLRIIPLEHIDWIEQDISNNLDVYIKCENMLQMTLDTNLITFADFNGTEDIIKENIINININSSLPYSLNAYLPVEIQNADKSNTMDKRILNIKENGEADYKEFTNINEKVVLKDNCTAGNDQIHGIDIKLKGGIAHEKDVYKTTIKFEAEQQ